MLLLRVVVVSIFLALFLAEEVAAIIPLPCANLESLTDRTCCPTPDIPGAGPCGENLGRGSCELVSVSSDLYDASERDVRKNWPIQYFERACVCNSTYYGGYDCGECSYGYNDGDKCEEKTVYQRVSVGNMDDGDWEKYRNALRKIKDTPARYMVPNRIPATNDPQAVFDSLVRPNTYDLLVWIHHFVAKDNEISQKSGSIVDFAHESTGFPTWHRLFLLWLEREIQVTIDDYTFRLPYWDWSQPSQREILFRRDRLGENVDEGSRVVVEGDLFDNGWDTFCWKDISGATSTIPICDPTVSSNEVLRRCPNTTLCEKDNDQWPSADDIDEAVSISAYDAYPYDRCVTEKETSFRNYMEGFIAKDSCADDSMCSETQCTNPYVTRKLHNTVHIILGLGDLKDGAELPFAEQGVMSCVAASPNDPVFISHHANIDCILEKWLLENKNKPIQYPVSGDIPPGHRATDYLVPFIPLYTHNDMFKTADNFGYSCFTTTPYYSQAFFTQPYTHLVVSLVSVTAALVMNIF